MSEKIKSVQAANVAGSRVLVRVDFNVPTQNGVIEDDARIQAAVPTLKLLQKNGAAHITLMTHWGRPEGVDENLRTKILFERLGQYIDTSNIEMLENLRFDPREEAGDEVFAKELAQRGDIYVDEAFANAHRAHASMVGVPKLLPSFAGLELMSEVEHLSRALSPAHPALAIIGGNKGETKIPLIERLSGTYDTILVGGALADTFASTASNVRLPEDGVPQLERFFDIGPQTRAAWVEEIKNAAFVLWNGPVGKYEDDQYRVGTDAIAQALVESSCTAVLGGGNTESAVKKFSFDPNRIFVSMGGGAMLEFLANGGHLPAIDVLE